MATELELDLFEEQLGEVAKLPGASRWRVEREKNFPLGLLVTMHPASNPAHSYTARIRWNGDLFGPFSLQFVNPDTGADRETSAWPQCGGFSPTAFAACIPITQEGHQLHPEWKTNRATRFPQTDTPVTFAIESVQDILDTSYTGRHP